jgi:hypothetical protein
MKRLLLFTLALTSSLLLHAAPLPPDKAYVQVSKEGTITLDGKRVRYWGAVLNHTKIQADEVKILPEDSPEVRQRKVADQRKAVDFNADRLAALGFNLVRSWDGIDFTQAYTMGDGSPQDAFAYACFAYEKRGIKLWLPQFNNVGNLMPEDVAIVNSPSDAASWQAAVTEWNTPKQKDIRHSPFYVFDPRTAALRIKGMKAIADFPNHYKGGLRLGDDPQVVVWELSNEEWWCTAMLNGRWQSQPKFFRDQMAAAWHAFLTQKYKTNATLTQAWGFLLPEESLDKKNVLLAPLANPVKDLVLNDVNPLAIAAQTAKQQTLTRANFTRQRGADVIEFFLGSIIARKKSERDLVKTWGKSCQLSPMVFDTGDGFRIQSVYLHQLADAVTMCTYLEGFAKDAQEPRFPWFSYLDEPPRMAHDVPWAEIGRVPGKPFFLYETQTLNPFKFRAEYPYRLLAQAAIQDWDIIIWHCYPRSIYPRDERPYDKALEVGHAAFSAEGFHFRFDEVQSAAMKTASVMFRNGAFKTVENPTTFVFGKDLLYDPVSMDYGKSFGPYAEKLAPTSFRHGLRMSVDPTLEKTTVTGNLVTPRVHEGNPIRSTSEIEWDWHRSHLKMDAPTAAAYTGFYAQHGGSVQFQNDLTLTDITVLNPPNAPYPVTEKELFIAFGIVAKDGKPLNESNHLELSLVSTSFNTGGSYKPENVIKGTPLKGGVSGTAPVLVSRVGGTLKAPWLTGMKYRLLDWHLNVIGEGVVKDGVLPLSANQSVFNIELTR